MTTVRALWAMARPLLLLVIVPIYSIGGLIARAFGHPLTVSQFVWGLATLLPVVLAAHYANEYSDVASDALTRRTPFSGGSGVLPGTDIPPSLALAAMGAFLAAGTLAALAEDPVSTGRSPGDILPSEYARLDSHRFVRLDLPG